MTATIAATPPPLSSPPPGERAEHDLAAGFVRGDESCLTVVYVRWAGLVRTLAARALGDPGEAEDVTQQVFLAAWRGRAGYRPERGPLPGWLVGIARRKTADALAARTRRRDLLAAVGAGLSGGGAQDPGPEDVLDRLVVIRELAKLSAAQREVLALAFYGDLTQVQIAERTGLPLGTVKSHTRRGLDRMSRSLREADRTRRPPTGQPLPAGPSLPAGPLAPGTAPPEGPAGANPARG
ncbi:MULTISPECIES: sigma-70 family RNA polymerase sigma factor [unclassified Streptomyces]|uniref:sigma-70 family RNA polymerase sigma factor n=1 Tax=unclassified Streptomyces TaxID=2593676 RepID=UPI0016605915|nr:MULTISPECIES: sigma-70 family RNA polymerase sigma factor [unclassified Streptomyces]